MSGIVIFGALAGSVTVLLTGFLAPEYFGYALAGFSVLLCIGLSGLRPVKLACAFLVLSVMVHTLKRSVFLVGEPSKGSYYALVAGPVCVAILLLFLLFTGKGRVRLPGSAFALLAYLMVAVVTTLLQSREFGAQAALFEYVVPTLLYFVGLNLPESAIGPLSRTAVRLAIASVAYGLWQFIVGPTFIDTAWAEKAQNISVQAVTVSQTLGGSAGLASRDIFRPYSLHSDPFAWALSLATMVALAGMAAPKTDSHSRWFPPSIMIALVGLPICLSRSPIFGFVAMLIFYLAVRKRYFKSPGLLVLTLAVAGIVAVSASQYVVDRFGFRESRDDTSVESRYLTVGTLSARTGAGGFLLDAFSEHPLVGAGLGESAAGVSRDGGDYDQTNIAWSHNIIVDLVYTAGGLGAICFSGFLYLFFREVLVMCRRRRDPAAFRVACWSLGAAGGFVVTGFASGAAFLNYDFFLLLGLGAGWAARRELDGTRVFATNRKPAVIRSLKIGESSSNYAN